MGRLRHDTVAEQKVIMEKKKSQQSDSIISADTAYLV
jgi:hypothetical protein